MFAGRRQAWEARLTKADVPCSRVWTIAEIVEHPQFAHRDVLQRVRPATATADVRRLGLPARARRRRLERPPALPGEHAEEILREAGYGEADIAGLRRDGAI